MPGPCLSSGKLLLTGTGFLDNLCFFQKVRDVGLAVGLPGIPFSPGPDFDMVGISKAE